MKFKQTVLLIVFFLSFSSTMLYSQVSEKPKPKPLTRILFVFDASQSMLAQWQTDLKITIANNMIARLLDSLKNVPDLQMGLRVFGHQKSFPPQDCDDSKLEVPIGYNTALSMKAKLKQLNPKGTTPIAMSLELAGNDFPPYDGYCRNIIILITDGLEECNGDPCAVSIALQKKGIILKPFVIGIGKNFKQQLGCVGNYFDAATESELKNILNIVISQALNSTTCQVNLLDEQGNPTETNVNMTFYDDFSGQIKNNYVHTLDNRGLPDTLLLDPLPTYNIVVHTIPPVGTSKVKLIPGKHTIIPIDAPQGYMELKMPNSSVNRAFIAIVRQAGKCETINTQYFGEKIKYITGKYDLEIECLPRLYIKDVEVKQSSTTKVEIPSPGLVLVAPVSKGYGAVYVEEDNKLKWVCNINQNGDQESIYLMPGNYRVIFRSAYATRAAYTIEKKFKVASGENVRVSMY